MAKIIILNAPPSSGKDIAAEWITEKYGAQHLRFKDQLYQIAAKMAGIPLTRMVQLSSNREYKEKPARFFRISNKFVSPRQWLIHCSENIVKPLAGKDYFGKSLASSADGYELVVVSDGGFMEEITPLIQAGHDIYVLRIIRDGYTFEGDSRNYFETSPLYKTILVTNNSTIDRYQNKIYSIVDDIVGISGVSGAV